ncbi:unknown [Sutterella sp. CAG:351]|nr:unknown [Sutterella sp. CAG:351]
MRRFPLPCKNTGSQVFVVLRISAPRNTLGLSLGNNAFDWRDQRERIAGFDVARFSRHQGLNGGNTLRIRSDRHLELLLVSALQNCPYGYVHNAVLKAEFHRSRGF